ncbi:hypothetical protein RIVM261_028840 [Rivularia sp. IAM M-261]|nr:hypothetical protein RIVM261_028840 [Rivularia sp. IAM M-261]
MPAFAPTYTENAAPIQIDATATVTDIDSSNFDTGALTVRFSNGGTADDRLSIRNEGTGANQINLDGREIYYGSTKIGFFQGGIGTDNLVISLNASATPAAEIPVTVDYSTANNTATAGVDYTAVSGTLTFNPGATSQNVIIPIIGDFVDELDESFFIN